MKKDSIFFTLGTIFFLFFILVIFSFFIFIKFDYEQNEEYYKQRYYSITKMIRSE